MVARYIQIGKMVLAKWEFILGSSSSVGTDPTVTYPVTAASDYTDTLHPVGELLMWDDGDSLLYGGHVLQDTTARVALYATDTAATNAKLSNLTSLVPFTWTNPDLMAFTIEFEAA